MELPIIKPFEPVAISKVPVGKKWIAQVKWDGVRILAYYEGEGVRLFNRHTHERTAQFPEVCDVENFCKARSIILDGEVIALDRGKPSFHEVMRRDGTTRLENIPRLREEVPVIYMIFDLLYINGKWVIDEPLEVRQNILEENIPKSDHIQVVESYKETEELFQVVQKEGLEGIVCKDLNSVYTIGGKDQRWQKVKNYQDLCALVGGVTFSGGHINALLLGLFDDDGDFRYIGRVGSGKLTVEEWGRLRLSIESLIIPEAPFTAIPKIKEALWVKPLIPVKVTYIHWTHGRLLRQPVLQALVNVSSRQCTFNQVIK